MQLLAVDGERAVRRCHGDGRPSEGKKRVKIAGANERWFFMASYIFSSERRDADHGRVGVI